MWYSTYIIHNENSMRRMIKLTVAIFAVSTVLYGTVLYAQEEGAPRVISSRSALTGPTTASFEWKTDKPSLTWIVYGETIAFDFEKKIKGYRTTHELILENLKPGTTYYYLVHTSNESGSEAVIAEQSGRFSTKNSGPEVKITQKKKGTVIVPIRFEGTAGGFVQPTSTTSFLLKQSFPIPHAATIQPSVKNARISWETDNNSFGSVKYGTTKEYGFRVGDDVQKSETTKKHTFLLEGLGPLMTVHFQIKTYDVNKNVSAFTHDLTFVTPSSGTGETIEVEDASMPALVSLKSSVSKTTMTFDFQTDEPSQAELVVSQLSRTAAEAKQKNEKPKFTASDNDFKTAHTLTVDGVQKDGYYKYALTLKDAAGNMGTHTYYLDMKKPKGSVYFRVLSINGKQVNTPINTPKEKK